MARILRHSIDDYFSSVLPSAQRDECDEARGLGRYVKGNGKQWVTDFRKTAAVFLGRIKIT
jgi:hypothetical protein